MKIFGNVKNRILIFAAAGIVLIAIAVLVLFFVFSGNTDEAGYRSIKIDRLEGTVQVANGDEQPYAAYETMHLYDGFSMSTMDESYSRLLLDDDKYIKIEENSHALFEGITECSNLTSISLAYGSMTNEIVKPLSTGDKYIVTTPNAVLSVRGTFFRTQVNFDEQGECFTDVYTYGGAVACRRIMPDGTEVDEDVVIEAGYKATIKMDEIITVYVEELIEEKEEPVVPINVPDVGDDDIVDMYVSSSNGHELFMTTNELVDEIIDRGIELELYDSYLDGKPVELVLDVEEETTSDTEPAETSAVVTSTSGSTTTPAETSVTTLVPDMAPFQGLMLTVQVMETEPVEGFSPVVWIDEGFDYDTTLPEPDGLMTEDTKAPETEMMTVAVTTADEADAVTSGTVPDTGMIAAVVEHTTTGTEDIFAGDFIYETIPVIIITTPETTTTDTEAETTVTTTEEVTATTAETTVKATTPAITTSVSQPVMAVNAPPNNTIIPTVTTPARGYAPIPDVPRVPVGVSISSVNFPDEVFRAYVIRNFDSDGNGYLDAAETEAAERIYLFSDNNVKSFEGIKYLTSLKYLNCREDSGVKRLDLSGNPELETLLCEDSVNLSSIKLAANSKLKDLRLEGTSIHSVDLSGCTVLQTIYCNNASLAYLDVSRCPNIKIFSVENNICPVTLTDNRFDLSTIPGFSVSRISRLRGAVLDGTVLTFTQDTVSYTYDCGQGHSGTFSLKAANYINASDSGSYPVIGGGVYCSVSEVTAGKAFDVIISVPPVNDSADVIEFRLDYDQEAFEIVSTDSSYSVSWNMNYGDGKWVLAAVRSQADIDLSKGLKFTLKFRCRDTAASGAYVFRLSKSRISRIDEVGSSGEIMLWQPEITVRNINVTGPASTGVAIDSTNFPNSTFRTYVSDNFDTDGDKYLSESEIEEAKVIYLSSANSSSTLYSMQGIEFLTSLTEITLRFHRGLKSIDLSKNKALTHADFYECSLTSLDVSHNTELTYLQCYYSHITELDVSNNKALTTLSCGRNSITELDLSNNTALTELEFSYSDVETLNIKNCSSLKSLGCNGNDLKYLDLSGCPALEVLSCDSCNLAYVDVSNCPNLTNFSCDYRYPNIHPVTLSAGNTFDLSTISGFDVSRMSGIRGAALDGTVLTFTQDTVSYTYDCGQGFSVSFSLKADNFNETSGSTGVEINEANFPDGAFRTHISTSFDKDGDGKLSSEEIAAVTYIDVPDTAVNLFGIEQFTALERFRCVAGITSIDLSNNTTIKEVYLHDWDIKEVIFGNNADLKRVEIINTYVTNVDLSGCPNIDYLYISGYGNVALESLDVSHNPELTDLTCSGCDVAYIDITNNPNITNFDGSQNSKAVDLTANRFDLSEIEGLDPQRMSNIDGATLSGNILTFNKYDITYYYDCGFGYTEKFKLYGMGFDSTLPLSTGVAIDSTNFPDDSFREYIAKMFDNDENGILSEEEIEAVTRIDVSGTNGYRMDSRMYTSDGTVASLIGIEYFTNLRELDCTYNHLLTSVDISHNTSLTKLYCSATNIETLDLSKNSVLTTLECGPNLDSLDVSHNTALTKLNINNTRIKSIDLSHNSALTWLYCTDNLITTIDLSNNTELVDIWLYNSRLAYVDISANNHNLDHFVIYGNKLPIPLSDTFDLNQIPGFDVSRMSDLTGAELDADGHTLINITGNVTYTYDCGQGHSETFTLVPTEGVTLSFGSAGEAISAPVSAENVSAPDDGDLQMPQKIYMPESHAEVYVAAVVAAVSVTVIAAVIVRRARKRSGEKEYDKK